MVNRTQNGELVALASSDINWTFISPLPGPSKHYGGGWLKECKNERMVTRTM